MDTKFSDVVIIGTGLGALSVALNLPKNIDITLLTKADLKVCSSYKAQGGIAAVLNCNDTIENHIKDTLIAGDGLCNKFAVEKIINQGAYAIEWLLSQGVNFDQDNKGTNYLNIHQTKEAGHSYSRIVHYKDITGYQIISKLLKKIIQSPNIKLYPHHYVYDLYKKDDNFILSALNSYSKNIKFKSKNCVIATGGLGQIFPCTTNSSIATGDGLVLAFKLGCSIENLEQIQFHPTVLKLDGAPSFLISEAIRGEGGLLKTVSYTSFMHKYDDRLELAPRDIVSRAIYNEINKSSFPYVYLDITHFSKKKIKNHFPNIYKICLKYGLDISKEPIPIAPAQHFSCGGIVTDLNGQTQINNLYAVGEVASTGLHGANRLASNALLECVVMGKAVANNILNYHIFNYQYYHEVKLFNYEQNITNIENTFTLINKKEKYHDILKKILMQTCGIIRQEKEIIKSINKIKAINKLNKLTNNLTNSKQSINLKQQITVSLILLLSSLLRKESIGLHYSLDYPNKNNPCYSHWIFKTKHN